MNHSHKSFINSFELKKKFLMHIIKVIRQLEKYEELKRANPQNVQINEKLAKKIPLFEQAIKKLIEKKNAIQFNQLDKMRSPNPKKENTIAFNSTMNDYSDFGQTKGKYNFNNESFKTGKNVQNDSGFGSINKMFDSIKTDNMSKFSDKQFMAEMKLNELVNNSALVGEKLVELQMKFEALKNLN